MRVKLNGCLAQQFFVMVDLITFRNDVTLVVTNMAKAVVTEIFTAAEKAYLFKQTPDVEVSCHG